MPIQFDTLYNQSFSQDVLGIDNDIFQSWQPDEKTYQSELFINLWPKISTIASIHITLVKLYQTKENILNIIKSPHQ